MDGYRLRVSNSAVFIFVFLLSGSQLFYRQEFAAPFPFNPFSLRKPKIVYSFGLSECNIGLSIDDFFFLKVFIAQESKQEVTKVISLGKNCLKTMKM